MTEFMLYFYIIRGRSVRGGYVVVLLPPIKFIVSVHLGTWEGGMCDPPLA